MSEEDKNTLGAGDGGTEGSREYLYQQLERKLKEDIEQGKYRPGERLPSMDELAKRYGINRLTVRRALLELRKQGLIYSIPAQGTYVSDLSKGGLNTADDSRLMKIGLVSVVLDPDSFGPYHTDIISGLQYELGQIHAGLVVVPSGRISDDEKIFNLVRRAELDGVIYMGPFSTHLLKRLVKQGPPSILVDYHDDEVDIDTLAVENRKGASLAIQHLVGLGHKRIGLITGDDQLAAQERLKGAREALKEAGIPSSDVVEARGDFRRDGGSAAIEKLLSGSRQPTAVFSLNDEMAAGALQYIHAKTQVDVPGDLSLIGFDDIHWAEASHPSLTTIRIDKSLLGRLAVQRLMARISQGSYTTTRTYVSTELIIRESTAAPRKE